MVLALLVIPAHAGIQSRCEYLGSRETSHPYRTPHFRLLPFPSAWIPACAGMTNKSGVGTPSLIGRVKPSFAGFFNNP